VKQYVGYVEVGELAIEILPKADRARGHGDARRVWREGLLDMLRVAFDIRLEHPDAASQETGRSSLLDMIALRFVEEVMGLLREGLVKGYRDEEENGATFRGRLMVASHLRENLVRADRFYVRSQTYDRDVPINRILAAALDAITTLALSPPVAARANICRAELPELSPLRVTPQLFDRIQLGRSTARYRHALELARLILERRAPNLRGGITRVFALLFDMNVLWERYIAAIFRKAAPPHLTVHTQQTRGFWCSDGNRARRIRPDLVVRRRDDEKVVLVADTKWKLPDLDAPSIDDLQQMFVYNELFGSPEAWLLYPCVDAQTATAGRYVSRDHRCATVELGVLASQRWNRGRIREQARALLAVLPA
jgi:5-methylcytosine-specific restriction enzyme subunit McrC